MKKIRYIIAVVFCTVLFTGCELDYNEVTGYTDTDRIFDGFENTRSFVTNIYGLMGRTAGFLPFDEVSGGGLLASATDEAEFAISFANIHFFYNGAWSPFSPILFWDDNYKGIRQVNIFLAESEGRTFDDFKENSDYNSQMQRFYRYQWEVRFLRAWFYFDIARKYGDAPFVGDEILDEESINNYGRRPVQEIFDYIIHECEVAAANLPDQYDGGLNDVGRATRGMALALKARAALYAASPLSNPDGDKALWLRAAKANKEVIDYMNGTMGVYLTGAYTNIWGSSNYNNPENILYVYLGNNRTLETWNFPAGLENANGGNCPTQNLVDAYQMKNGLFWNDPGSGYVDGEFDNRDPRLGMTIAVNGETGWPLYNTNPLETFIGGANGQPLTVGTPTGYYLKKWLDASVDLRPNSTVDTRHAFVVFRLAEFYLNYAEAVYRYLGNPDAIVSDLPLSATDAINIVRARPGVDMPPLPLQMNDDTFWKYYESERMVELAFEDHRFYDVRRWKLGAERFTKIIEMKITRNSDGTFDYKRETVTRSWNEKMNLFPIWEYDIRRNTNLTQNPGWELF